MFEISSWHDDLIVVEKPGDIMDEEEGIVVNRSPVS